MRIRRLLVPAAFAAIAMVGAEVAPATARVLPDPSIKTARKADGPYVHGALDVNLESGQKKTFYLKVKNGTDDRAELWLGSSGPVQGFVPKYFYKGENITEDVDNFLYEFNVRAGKTRKFTMTVKRTQLSGPAACIYTNIEVNHSFHDGTQVLINGGACA